MVGQAFSGWDALGYNQLGNTHATNLQVWMSLVDVGLYTN